MPTKLNMRATPTGPLPTNSAPASPAPAAPFRPSTPSLNVMFNYNGHTFDAYETLGLPAGSSWDEVRAAFEKNISKSESPSHEFFLTAFNAIKTQQNF